MKKKLLCFLLLLAGLGIYAAPFKNMPVYFTQPDGTQYHCLASGDEYYHFMHDANGFVIIQSQDGWFYYATHDANGDQIASEFIAGKIDPVSAGLQPNMHISQAEYRKRFDVYNSYPKLKSGTKGTHDGTINNIVVYIKFHDDTDFINTRGYYDDLFNSETNESLYNYYKEVSYDQLYIVAHHYPASANTTNVGYTDIYDRSYYEPYNQTTNPNGYTDNQQASREHSLLKRAIESVKATVEAQFTADELDINGDGIIDNICFIVRGQNGEWNDLLWAHSWVLYTYNVSIKGKRVYQYTWQPETQADVYTFCHEMYHALGAPDLYHYSYDGNTNVGPWDLMESGFVHMGAWMKYKYADKTWVKEMPEITKAGTYTLKPLATSQDSNCFKIKSSNSESEFYVVEYRKLGGLYEKNCPGSGLLVYRIDSTLDGNAQGPPNEVYIYRPGGTTTSNGNINMAFFNNHVNRTEINDNTDPSGFLSDGTMGGLNISEIGDAGATISFSVSFDKIDQPNDFFTQVSSSIGVGLYWQPNANNDSVIIAYSTSEISSNPVSGTSYQVGDNLYNGEQILYVGNDKQEFAHTGLEGGTTYYYKIWSVENARYSAALKATATTYCDQTFKIPYNQEFKNDILPQCWNVDDPLHNNQVWEFANIGGVSFNSFTEVNGIACINSAYFGLNQTQNSGMISPIFDFTDNDFIYLTFKHYLRVDLDRTQARFLYSTDSCKTWNEIASWTSSTNDGELFEVNLSDILAGKSSVRFKFDYEATADRYWCIDDFRILGDFLSVADIKNKTNSSVSPYRNKVVSIATTVTKMHVSSGNIFTQDTSAIWSGLPISLDSGDDTWTYLHEGDSVIVTALISDYNKVPQLNEPTLTKVGTSVAGFTPFETELDAIVAAKQMYNGLYVKISNLELVSWDNDWYFDNNGKSVVIKQEDTDFIFGTGHIYNIAGIYFEKDGQIYLVPLSNDDITDVSEVNGDGVVLATVYPIPFSDRLKIETEVGAKIEILDLSGRVILETSANEVGRLSIDTESWLPGSYLVRISTDKEVQILKTVKTK